MAMDSEYNWDLPDNGNITLILFFSFVYFNKNTNFNQTHVTCVESITFCINELLWKVLFTFFNSCTIHDRKEAISNINNNVETTVFHASYIKAFYFSPFNNS